MNEFLQNTGIESTFSFLQYVGVLKNRVSAKDFHKTVSELDDEYSHCGHDRLKEILGYEFNDKKLLAEALTHHSYFNDFSVDCNYKMAFLGESILGTNISLLSISL